MVKLIGKVEQNEKQKLLNFLKLFDLVILLNLLKWTAHFVEIAYFAEIVKIAEIVKLTEIPQMGGQGGESVQCLNR